MLWFMFWCISFCTYKDKSLDLYIQRFIRSYIWSKCTFLSIIMAPGRSPSWSPGNNNHSFSAVLSISFNYEHGLWKKNHWTCTFTLFNLTLDILSGFSVSSENSLSANNVKHAAFQLKIDNDSFSCSHSNVTVTHLISIKNVSGKT